MLSPPGPTDAFVNPRSTTEAVQALLKTQNPSWKALVLTFIWLARTSAPTRILCLPRIMSNESEMEKTLVPPVKGANPRSPRDQKPPPTIVERSEEHTSELQ